MFEWAGFYRPMSDLALYLPTMRAAPRYAQTREWLAANDRFRRDVLARLRADGPLRTSEIPDTSQVSWPSSGWTNDRNVTQLLEILAGRGEVVVSGREGKERLWDLAERVYPARRRRADASTMARHRRDERRLASLGIARAKATPQPVEPIDVGEAGEEAVVDGVAGTWRVDPAAVGVPFEGAHGPALALRSTGLRPAARRGDLRLRVHPRDVQAGGQAPLGLLRPAHPAQRPAGRKARCQRPTARRGSSEWPRSTKTWRSPRRSRMPCTARSAMLAEWLGLDVVGPAVTAQRTASTISSPANATEPRSAHSSVR